MLFERIPPQSLCNIESSARDRQARPLNICGCLDCSPSLDFLEAIGVSTRVSGSGFGLSRCSMRVVDLLQVNLVAQCADLFFVLDELAVGELAWVVQEVRVSLLATLPAVEVHREAALVGTLLSVKLILEVVQVLL